MTDLSARGLSNIEEAKRGRLAFRPHTLQILGAGEHHQISDRHILRAG
jgi:hypothetical protein